MPQKKEPSTRQTKPKKTKPKQAMAHVDFLVVGGGMVGAATALGLAKCGKKVGLIEPFLPEEFDPSQAMDLRVSAISPASIALLDELQVWQRIKAMRTCAYQFLETWEQPLDLVSFEARELGLDELGFIVENRIIQLALWDACKDEKNIHFYAKLALSSLSFDGKCHVATLNDGTLLSSLCVIGADGANSAVRDYANIGISAWDYRHHCMLINVKAPEAKTDMTWQCFTPSGPRAFLPLPSQQASLVWYDSPARIRELSALPPEKLKDEIERHFPKRLGQIEVLSHGSFPLTRRHAKQYHKQNVVLVGDAAHTINPLAGQGVNLGFKDVSVLLELVEANKDEKITDALWQAYERRRKPDNLLMQTGMDLFYKSFSNDIYPLKLIRNLGFNLIEKSPRLKKQILRYALGL